MCLCREAAEAEGLSRGVDTKGPPDRSPLSRQSVKIIFLNAGSNHLCTAKTRHAKCRVDVS